MTVKKKPVEPVPQAVPVADIATPESVPVAVPTAETVRLRMVNQSVNAVHLTALQRALKANSAEEFNVSALIAAQLQALCKQFNAENRTDALSAHIVEGV